MAQWEPALDIVGKENGIRIDAYFLRGCPFASTYDTSFGSKPYVACVEWSKQVVDILRANPPDLVITSVYHLAAVANPSDPISAGTWQILGDGLHDVWGQLADAGIPTAMIVRNPQSRSTSPDLAPDRAYDCVAKHMDALDRCVGEADYTGPGIFHKIVEFSPTPVWLIDLNSYICGQGRCPAVIGGVVVYRTGAHLTRTFVETLAPRLGAEIIRVLSENGLAPPVP